MYTVVACQAISNIVKTSLGPVGLDKVSYSDPSVSDLRQSYIYIHCVSR